MSETRDEVLMPDDQGVLAGGACGRPCPWGSLFCKEGNDRWDAQ
jgi:hypothetical protein